MLTRNHDRKVTMSLTPKGQSRVQNAFGLPSGNQYSCPGQTEFCGKICYAGKLERLSKHTKAQLVANFQELVYADYLGGIDAMVELLAPMIQDFRNDSAHWNSDLKFRIHWDGDFWSYTYAIAWREVILANPDIQFWVYTRSFTDQLDVVCYLFDIPNLILYLSSDKDNHELAEFVANEYDLPIATVADTFDEAMVIHPTAEFMPTYKCPENRKSLPMSGACNACGVCIEGRGDVLFSVKKR